MRIAIALAALVALVGCGSSPQTEAPKPPAVPETFKVKFTTSQGEFTVEANRAWAPIGVDRFHELLGLKYFDDNRFFRVVKGYIAQFGVNGDPKFHGKWRKRSIVDDKLVQSNERGTLTYAQAGPNSRATEIFINLKNNKSFDQQGFVPFAKVVEGMDVVDKLYSGYGELLPTGREIDPGKVEERGNEYLNSRFPKLDYILKAEILK
jgi:peptidyl-prolyl cis-trans isomerase A (cyclophilin A)